MKNNYFIFHHQTRRSLGSKKDEFGAIFKGGYFSPHLAGTGEHHITRQEMLHVSTSGYNLASSFYQQ